MILALLLGCEAEKSWTPQDRDEEDLVLDPVQEVRGDTIDALGGPVTQPFPGPGVAVGDYDGDGFLDVFFAAGTPQSVVLRNDGAGTLVADASFTADGGPLPGANTTASADFDGDGDLDLFVGTPDDDRLLLNDGAGAFTSVLLSGAGHTTTSALPADLDGDGDLDLLCARHSWPVDIDVVRAGLPTEDPSTLYMNLDGTWVEDPDRLPFEARKLYAHHGAVADLDADGDLDAYLTSDFGLWSGGNTALLNDGYGFFSLAEGTGLEAELGGRGVALGDLGYDGVPDVFLSNIGPPALLESVGEGRWMDQTASHRLNVPMDETHGTGWGTTTVDLNGDGLLDLALSYGKLFIAPEYGSPKDREDVPEDPDDQTSVVWLNQANGRFVNLSADTGFDIPRITKSVVVGDLDRDGRADLLTAGFLDLDLVPFVQVWRVDGGWGPGVTLRFEGPTPIGTRVDVTADDETAVRWLTPSTSYSSSAPEVYLGTGGTDGAESIVVTWPDGQTTDLGEVASGGVVVVER